MIMNRDYSIRIGTTAPGIDSYVVKYRDFYTIVISDSLSPEGRRDALSHEVFHIQNGDLDSDADPELMEIIAHRRDG